MPGEHNPSPNPVSISMRTLREMRPDEYVVAEKTDGVRFSLLLCRDHLGRNTCVMVDRACRKYEVRVCAQAALFDGTLLDGELVYEYGASAPQRRGEKDSPAADDARALARRLVYWVFDVACLCGEPVRDRNYAARFRLLHRTIDDPAGCPLLPPGEAERYAMSLAAEGKIAPFHNPHSLCFRAKECFDVRSIDILWRRLNCVGARAPGHRHDGLVFTPIHDSLPTGTHWRQFKWKSEHTVDFELRGLRGAHGDDASGAARAPSSMPRDWTYGLYYVKADWTVAKADARDRAGPSVPVYKNACRGLKCKRSALPRASAPADAGAPTEQHRPSHAAPAGPLHDAPPAESPCAPTAGDPQWRKVLFVLDDSPIVARLTHALVRRDPAVRHMSCIVECAIRFADPLHDDVLLCAVKRIRADKTEPNNRFTVRQTVLNLEEAITYELLRSVLLRGTRL